MTKLGNQIRQAVKGCGVGSESALFRPVIHRSILLCDEQKAIFVIIWGIIGGYDWIRIGAEFYPLYRDDIFTLTDVASLSIYLKALGVESGKIYDIAIFLLGNRATYYIKYTTSLNNTLLFLNTSMLLLVYFLVKFFLTTLVQNYLG